MNSMYPYFENASPSHFPTPRPSYSGLTYDDLLMDRER